MTTVRKFASFSIYYFGKGGCLYADRFVFSQAGTFPGNH